MFEPPELCEGVTPGNRSTEAASSFPLRMRRLLPGAGAPHQAPGADRHGIQPHLRQPASQSAAPSADEHKALQCLLACHPGSGVWSASSHTSLAVFYRRSSKVVTGYTWCAAGGRSPAYDAFAAQHGRKHASAEEYQSRLATFHSNLVAAHSLLGVHLQCHSFLLQCISPIEASRPSPCLTSLANRMRQEFIEQHNAREDKTHTLAANRFTDWTEVPVPSESPRLRALHVPSLCDTMQHTQAPRCLPTCARALQTGGVPASDAAESQQAACAAGARL